MPGLLSAIARFGDGSISNLRRLGFLKEGTEATERNIKSALTRYEKSLSNPAVRRRELLRRDGQDIYKDSDLGKEKIVTPEDMFGNTLVPVFGDKTVTGRNIDTIQGIDLPTSQLSAGGARFIQQQQDTPLAYASMETAAARKQGNFDYAADETNNPNVLGVYTASADPAYNFTNPTAGSLFQMTQSLNLPKNAKKIFDDEVRLTSPEWVGLDSPLAYDQLMGTGEFNMKGAGALRIEFVNAMDKAKFRDIGFPLRSDVINVIAEPGLANVNRGDSGFGILGADIGGETAPFSAHPAYSHSIPGSYFGRTAESVPAKVMFPDAFQWMENQGRSPNAQLGSLMMDPKLYQPANQKWLDNYNSYLETGKTLYSRPEAGILASMVALDQSQPNTIDSVQSQIHNNQVDASMNAIGIDPSNQAGYEYGDILPFRRNNETGDRELALPSFLRDAARGLIDLSTTRKTGVFNPQSIFDVML